MELKDAHKKQHSGDHHKIIWSDYSQRGSQCFRPCPLRPLRYPKLIKKKFPFAWEIVVWLWLAYFKNQADRQLYSVVQKQEKQVQEALRLSDIQAGLVNTVLIASMAIMMPAAASS